MKNEKENKKDEFVSLKESSIPVLNPGIPLKEWKLLDEETRKKTLISIKSKYKKTGVSVGRKKKEYVPINAVTSTIYNTLTPEERAQTRIMTKNEYASWFYYTNKERIHEKNQLKKAEDPDLYNKKRNDATKKFLQKQRDRKKEEIQISMTTLHNALVEIDDPVTLTSSHDYLRKCIENF